MELGLKGKGVVVTGASSGIGRAIALEFAHEGANLAICARGREALEKARSELEAKGVEVYAQVCDVSDIVALNMFLESAHSSLRQIDVLINNASGWGVSDDEMGWAASFSVDIMAGWRRDRPRFLHSRHGGWVGTGVCRREGSTNQSCQDVGEYPGTEGHQSQLCGTWLD
jgi:3-oxoacyl-[acyl-carrier protein] reductase